MRSVSDTKAAHHSPPPIAEKGAISLPQLLLRQVRKHSAEVALRHKHLGMWHRWSWREVYHEVAHVARSFMVAGIGAGECVAIWADAHPRTLFTALGAQASGASVLPIPLHSSKEWLVRALEESLVSVVMVRTRQQADLVRAAAPPNRQPLVVVAELDDHGASDTDDLLSYRRFTLHGDVSSGPSLEQVKASIDAADGAAPAFHYFPDDLAAQWRRTAVDHLRLVSAAIISTRRDQLTARDEVLGDSTLWFLPHVHLILAQWLTAGFRLSLPEQENTLEIDRRELAPTVMYARSRYYDQMITETAQRAGAPDSRRRRWIASRIPALNEAAVQSSRPHRNGLFDSLLLVGPLRRVLGLARVRLAVASDVELSARAQRFLDTLRVPVASLSEHQSVINAIQTSRDHGHGHRHPEPARGLGSDDRLPIEELAPGNPLGATL